MLRALYLLGSFRVSVPTQDSESYEKRTRLSSSSFFLSKPRSLSLLVIEEESERLKRFRAFVSIVVICNREVLEFVSRILICVTFGALLNGVRKYQHLIPRARTY